MKYVPPLGAGSLDAPYVDGNPEHGIEGSPVPAASIEHPQREIVHAIASAGLVPDQSDLTQLALAITMLAASGRACASWVSAAIAEGGVLTLPENLGYTVGAGALILAWEGLVLDAENYNELGEAGKTSRSVKLLFPVSAGSRFWAAVTAPVGGHAASALQPDVLARLANAITRAENAAALADAARVALGDPLFVEQQQG